MIKLSDDSERDCTHKTPHGVLVPLFYIAWSPSSLVSHRCLGFGFSHCHTQHGVPVLLSHSAWSPGSPVSHRMESQFACLNPHVPLSRSVWSPSSPVSHRMDSQFAWITPHGVPVRVSRTPRCPSPRLTPHGVLECQFACLTPQHLNVFSTKGARSRHH